MKCFHGTSLANAINIINGSTDKPTGLWQESDCDNMFYVFPLDKISNHFGLECYLPHERLHEIIHDVAWHGQTSLLFEPMHHTKYVVLEMEIDDFLLADDHSCPNMDDVASCIYIDDIKHVKFEAVHVGVLNPWDRPYFLTGILDRDNVNIHDMDPSLVKLATDLADHTTLHWSDIEIHTERYDIEHFKKLSWVNK